MTNQEILKSKNGYMITMGHRNPYLEVRTLVLVWMDITTSLMMTQRVMKRVTLMRRNAEDYRIPLR